MMSNIFKIVLCSCVVIRFFVIADTKEELKKKYAKTIMDCAKDFPLSSASLKLLREGTFPDDLSVKCLFACTYKNIGMMDDKGQLSVDGVKKISQKYFADSPEKMKKADEFTEACLSVNEVSVSDGEKGCERAALIFKCTLEKAPQFDFV